METLAYKIDKINVSSQLKKINSGTAKDLEELWTSFIEPLLPKKNIVIQWHHLLLRYVNSEYFITCLRTYGNYKDRNKKDKTELRRGFFNITNIGIDTVFVDNFFTAYFYSMAYDGYVPTYDDFYEIMVSRRMPVSHLITKTEEQYSAFSKGKKVGIQLKGYKVAHIYSAGEDYNIKLDEDTIGKFCRKYFPRSDVKDWSNINIDKYGKYHYRSVYIPSQDIDKVREFLIAHFLRTVHPINYFLIPKKQLIKFIPGGDIGEYKPLIKYVEAKLYEIYGDIYTEYRAYIMPINDIAICNNDTINAYYGECVDGANSHINKHIVHKENYKIVNKSKENQINNISVIEKLKIADYFLRNNDSLRTIERNLLGIYSQNGSKVKKILDSLGVSKDKKGVLIYSTIEQEIGNSTDEQYINTLSLIKNGLNA